MIMNIDFVFLLCCKTVIILSGSRILSQQKNNRKTDLLRNGPVIFAFKEGSQSNSQSDSVSRH